MSSEAKSETGEDHNLEESRPKKMSKTNGDNGAAAAATEEEEGNYTPTVIMVTGGAGKQHC